VSLVSLVNNCFAAITVFVFLFYDGGTVSGLTLFDYRCVVPITIPVKVPVAFTNAYASADRTNVNADIIGQRRSRQRRNRDNHD
jgi:hypothetical protein